MRILAMVKRTLAAVLLLPAYGFAAGDGGEAIVFVADSRRYSGWEAWFTNLYNDSLLYFSVLTVVLIPAIGALLGVVADLIMRLIGIDLKTRRVSEH